MPLMNNKHVFIRQPNGASKRLNTSLNVSSDDIENNKNNTLNNKLMLGQKRKRGQGV